LTAAEAWVAKLVYSYAIGLSCWALTDVTRSALIWLLQRAAIRRGVAIDIASRKLGWPLMLPLMVLALVLGPLAGLRLAMRSPATRRPAWPSFGSSNTRLVLSVTLVAMLVSTLFIGLRERLGEVRSQAETSQRAATEHQLKLLQAQLEPHMLFNTLANLRVLIGTDPARAVAMLDRLNAFLRASLTASRFADQPLSVEFDRLRDYLALMGFRMGERLQYRLDLPASWRRHRYRRCCCSRWWRTAFAMVLEPKIEGGRIEVTARASDGRLVLSVRDTGVGLGASPPSDGANFGVEQVRSRLRTLHGDRASFTLARCDDAEGGTLAVVSLPLSSRQSP
jgi:LytS/YehU family sensor histidine kinase